MTTDTDISMPLGPFGDEVPSRTPMMRQYAALTEEQREIVELRIEADWRRVQLAIAQRYIEELSDLCYNISADAGWWTDLETGLPLERNRGEMLMLIVTEIAEAMEGVRKNIPDDHLPQYTMEEVELADALIRIFDYAGGHRLRVGEAMIAKLEYNKTRADHKIENRQKAGGKKC